MADTQTLHTNITDLKREYHEGLDELESIFAHNTADRTHEVGRPQMNPDGTRTYRLADDTETLRLELVSVVQKHSAKADGTYTLDAFDFPGRERARVTFCRAGQFIPGDEREHTVCWLRPARRDFWTTPKVRALHEELIDDLARIHSRWFLTSKMVEPPCPECSGEGCIDTEVVDWIDEKAVCCTVIEICQVCRGQGVLR